MKKIFTLVGIVLLSMAFSEYSNLDKIIEKFEKYVAKYPYQEIYLQTDREIYQAKDILWFKAYLRQGKDLRADSLTVNLYIDLINRYNQTQMSKLLKVKNGTAWGEFPLPDSLPDGKYMLRVYTQSLRNFGADYFFTKEITVQNTDAQYFKMSEYQVMKKKKRKETKLSLEYDLQFLPEGGYLLIDRKTRVAFKAINQLEQGVKVKGVIFDSHKRKVAHFESTHLGMGSFEFMPQKNEKYKAQVVFEDKTKKTFDLPLAQTQGFAMQINNLDDNNLEITILANLPQSNDKNVSQCYILIQNAGKLLYTKEASIEENEWIWKIKKSDLSHGIHQITLINGYFQPVSERLIFIDKKEHLPIQISGLKTNYTQREKVEWQIKTLPKTHLGISVVSEDCTDPQNDVLMQNYFDLKSKIVGKIENVNDYFDTKNADRLEKLDLLLLTQAWRRYEWQKILNDTTKVKYQEEPFISINGHITRDLFGVPVKGIDVNLTLMNKFNENFVTKTNEKGQFRFANLNYNDTLEVLIEARLPNGKKNVVIYIEEDLLKEPNYWISPQITPEIYATKGYKQKREAYIDPKVRQYDEGEPHQTSLHNSADQIIYMEKVNTSGVNSVEEIVKQHVPGFYGSGATANFRGINSIMGSSQPLLLIDDIMLNYDAINSISVNDVDRIEILKGANASIYGLRGSTGVIAVYSKQGRYMKRGEIQFDMLGYATPKTFYSPKYSSVNSDFTDLRKTIYWNPEIITNAEGIAKISFHNADTKGTFIIRVEGMNGNGKVGSQRFSYRID